ncbi:MAG TPA: flagellar hook-associated protein FlgK [Acidisarcina sp.]
MSGLDTSLFIGVQALGADEGALQITNNNIANANTPGYSREVVSLSSAPATDTGQGVMGNGVELNGYQSIRDEVLQTRIAQQTQQNGEANAQLSSLQQVQTAFTTSTQDIGTEFSNFFTGLSGLATNPANPSARQGVLSSAQNLVNAFHTASAGITERQTGLNDKVTQDVTQINNLSAQIASISRQIESAKGAGENTGAYQDQQDQLVLSLSKLTSVSVTHTEGTDTLSMADGTPLVSGGQSFALGSTTGSDGFTHVLDSSGHDITSTMSGGDLGGNIQVRDVAMAGVLAKLDTLASQFAGAVNAAQAKGFDQNGAAGQNLLTVPATVPGSAASISLATMNTTAIAASSDGSPGSNGNLVNLTAVQTALLPSGQNPTDAYASIVFEVGTLTANAQADATATSSSLTQLTDQRNAVSGVSVDEESANLIRYQQAYEAAARVVTTVQALIVATMSMGTAAAA